MRPALLVLCALLLSPIAASAASNANIGAVTCTGSQSTSLADVASFFCSGDYALLDGNISSDSKITITADGSLLINNLSISAPAVELTAANGTLTIGDGVSINTNSFLVQASDNTTQPVTTGAGAVITVGTGDNAHTVSPEELSASVNQPIIATSNGDTGGTIVLVPSVPEPSNLFLMSFGILALFALLGSKRAGKICSG